MMPGAETQLDVHGRVGLSLDVQRRASRYVAGQAIDVADARHLLDVLGLVEQPKVDDRWANRPVLAGEDVQHGLRGTYWQGCRCERCTKANTSYQRVLAAKKREGKA